MFSRADLLVLSRVHVTGTMNTVVQRNLELPSDLARVSRSDVASASRGRIGVDARSMDSVSRSSGVGSDVIIPMRIERKEWSFPRYSDEDSVTGNPWVEGEFVSVWGREDWQDGGYWILYFDCTGRSAFRLRFSTPGLVNYDITEVFVWIEEPPGTSGTRVDRINFERDGVLVVPKDGDCPDRDSDGPLRWRPVKQGLVR